jgi:hypothetical protein
VILQAVFLDWIGRLEKYIATDGDYVEWPKTKIAGQKILLAQFRDFHP